MWYQECLTINKPKETRRPSGQGKSGEYRNSALQYKCCNMIYKYIDVDIMNYQNREWGSTATKEGEKSVQKQG